MGYFEVVLPGQYWIHVICVCKTVCHTVMIASEVNDLMVLYKSVYYYYYYYWRKQHCLAAALLSIVLYYACIHCLVCCCDLWLLMSYFSIVLVIAFLPATFVVKLEQSVWSLCLCFE